MRLGADVVLEITGLRNPCGQINDFRPGLLKEVVAVDGEGGIVRKSGVMAVVLSGGVVRPGDPIDTTMPSEPHEKLVAV